MGVLSKFKAKDNDLTSGPLLPGILLYTLPLILSGVLQLLFNAADLVVVGRFAGETALAAVGSTGALINLIVNVFMGLSVGAASCTALNYGAKNEKSVHRTVHTAMLLSIVGGIAVLLIGVLFSETFLLWMDTPKGPVLDGAALYMKIYFIGAPAMMIYNFGAAILRAIGDTTRPLWFLTIAGIVNVILNLILAYAGLGVAGVAIATTVSQLISAILVVRHLMKTDASYRLYLNKLKIYGRELKMILRIGLPAGLQGSVFAVSNVVIQSSVNTFGELAMSGSTASGNIESFIYMAMNAFHHTALSFTAQNLGAGNTKKMKKIFVMCMGLVVLTGVLFGGAAYIFSEELLGIYIRQSDVAMAYGVERLQIIALTYCICGMMDVMTGVLRGMGASFIPMIICLVGACGTRVLWVNTIFKMEGNHTFTVLFRSYPVSWILTVIAQLIFYAYLYYFTIHKKHKRLE